MNHEHTLSPGCWCAPIVVHVPPLAKMREPMIVTSVRDADRLAALGITNVVVNPAVPVQRGGGGKMSGGEAGDAGNPGPWKR